jgi:tetratricopeptide (TPR) repeat protein
VEADAFRQRLTEALAWVDEAFVGDPQDVRSWMTLDPLIPHAASVADHADASGIVEPTIDVMGRLATLLRGKALHSRAERYYRRGLAIAEDHSPPDDPRIAICLNNLAQLLQDTNRLGEAEPLMRRALAIDEASYGPDHPNVAIQLSNLATLLQATNRLGEAEPLMRRALAIEEAGYGPDHPRVAIGLNNLAQLLQATNRLGEAEPLMRRHLAIFLAFQRDTGHAHPHRDAAIGNYAALLAAMGKTEADTVATLQVLMREVLMREVGLDPG